MQIVHHDRLITIKSPFEDYIHDQVAAGNPVVDTCSSESEGEDTEDSLSTMSNNSEVMEGPDEPHERRYPERVRQPRIIEEAIHWAALE